MFPRETLAKILQAQRNELTEHFIYAKLAGAVKEKAQREILEKISADELAHYRFFKDLTRSEATPDRLKIFVYVFLARALGLNFSLKLMEKGEDLAQHSYAWLKQVSPEIAQIIRDEESHEQALLSLIDEERLQYVSSMVLGLNDALVELTGALAGFTLAIPNTRLIGMVGLITGIAASMSMAASEYLSTKQEETGKSPLKASVYTGLAYVATVMLLIFPYLVFPNVFLCLGLVVFNALLVILVFTFYISIAKGLDFRKRFLEMAALSLSIAAINFVIGLIIKKVFDIET